MWQKSIEHVKFSNEWGKGSLLYLRKRYKDPKQRESYTNKQAITSAKAPTKKPV